MPTYLHQCDNAECLNEWEDYYSIASEPKTTCPVCQQQGHRVIAGGSGRGIVSLTGQDLVNKVRADANAIESHAAKNEQFAANFINPDTYQRRQSDIDNAKKDGLFRRSR
jgi:hypothetical protein